MNSAISFYRLTDFSYLESKRCILEWLLHLTFLEEAKITILACASALRVLGCKLSKYFRVAIDLLSEFLYILSRLI